MKRHMTALRRRRNEHGQVLMLAVVALVLVVIATLLLFDVQNVITSKIKGQNGVDAAALTAAEWQRHSLNLIGELNLIRATGTLISDPFLASGIEDTLYEMNIESLDFEIPDYKPGPTQPREFTRFPEREEFLNEDGSINREKLFTEIFRVEREITYLANLDDLISQLQTRISFVGPLIGFGAAQQAAKNNGLTSGGGRNELNEFFGEYLRLLRENENIQTSDDIRFVNDYDWPNHYLEMLYSILGYNGANGLAVGIRRFKFIGMPLLGSDPPTELAGFLGNKYFYQHILGHNWCELDNVLKMDFNGNWWSDFKQENNKEENDDIPKQSEILPLYIKFSYGSHEEGRSDSQFDEDTPYAKALNAGAFGSFAKDDELFSSIFNTKVPFDYEVDYSESYSPKGNVRKKNYNSIINALGSFREDSGRVYNLLPLLSWAIYVDNEWYPYSNGLKDRAEDFLRTPLQEGMDYTSGAIADLVSTQPLRTISSPGSVGRTRTGSRRDRIVTTALAKPLGRIKTEKGWIRPFEAGGMVLPVFEKVALFPMALEGDGSDSMSMSDIDWYYFLSEFIPLLAESATLEEAIARAESKPGNHSGYYKDSYYRALTLLNDPDFRKRGLDWLNTPVKWDTDSNGNRYPVLVNRDNCHLTGGSSQPTFSLH